MEWLLLLLVAVVLGILYLARDDEDGHRPEPLTPVKRRKETPRDPAAKIPTLIDAADVLAMSDPDEAWGQAMRELVSALIADDPR